ncbi:hypothetical protein PR003_g27289 [Phytophthora rubi]|uniref:Uncharacterized protein n=1 Tax=Phytophthora rubi TaxID=129364 RepID=A0A6A3HTN2_9STRA|nr:hypothetical protein PR002_g26335 [Phytophthora rubi]KAE9032410.1 hypothetical protein PR001_g10619 [Phytophthora rubi]KAE9282877.1 hypothetical protein PR003_g27289 [Phytophthora rubi]
MSSGSRGNVSSPKCIFLPCVIWLCTFEFSSVVGCLALKLAFGTTSGSEGQSQIDCPGV